MAQQISIKEQCFDMLMSYEAKVKNLEAALLELCNDAGVPSVAKLKEFILNTKKEPE